MICNWPVSLLNERNIRCSTSSMTLAWKSSAYSHPCLCRLKNIEHLGFEYPRHSSKPIFWLKPFPAEGGYISVEICRSRQLLGNLDSPAPAFHYFLSRPWLHQSFNLRYRSSRWNPLRWTQKHFLWPWKGFRWILQSWRLCTASWTSPTEWSVPHQSSKVLITDISWWGLRLRKVSCY